MPALNETLRAVFGAEPLRFSAISGGDINEAFKLTLTDGTQVFMKANRSMPVAFFEAEAEGLNAIRETKAIRVPGVIAVGQDARFGAYLLLEWVEAGRPFRDFWEDFGRALAAMHRAPASDRFGWGTDNFIGASAQVNALRESWVDFFRDCRLAPQFRKAERWFDAPARKRAAHLLDHLDDHLPEPARPSLLHGDLWSGNFIAGPDGRAWLIDPAVYVGCAEADLAMTELFGGFRPAFYAAYREANPLPPGYEKRRDLYNLYHLLNHLNLFGGGYLGAVLDIVRRYS